MNSAEKARKQHNDECVIRVTGCCGKLAICSVVCRYYDYAVWVRAEKEKYKEQKEK